MVNVKASKNQLLEIRGILRTLADDRGQAICSKQRLNCLRKSLELSNKTTRKRKRKTGFF